MRSVTLSGWGQPADALSIIAPEARVIEYAHHRSVEDALTDIGFQGKDAELVIGWSLGGQLVARAITRGLLKPKALVLIASAFQFVADSPTSLGMKRFTYDTFRNNYAANPARTLDKGWALVALDDVHSSRVRHHMEQQDKQALLQKDWLFWLDALNDFTFESERLHKLPPTLLIHGENDAVVEVAQSERFVETLPDAQLLTFTGCGHAPHWHDPDSVKKAIAEFIS